MYVVIRFTEEEGDVETCWGPFPSRQAAVKFISDLNVATGDSAEWYPLLDKEGNLQ